MTRDGILTATCLVAACGGWRAAVAVAPVSCLFGHTWEVIRTVRNAAYLRCRKCGDTTVRAIN